MRIDRLDAGTDGESHAEKPRVIQFSGSAPVRLFPPPEMGEGRVGVKAGGVPQAMLLPPIPTFPR